MNNLSCSEQALTMLIFSLFTFFPLLTAAQSNRESIRQGDIAYAHFDNLNALASYKKALTIQPNDFEYRAKVVRACNDTGEDLSSEESESYYEQAVQQAEKLQKMFPDKAESYYWLAVSYGNLALLRGSREKVKLSSYVEKNIQKALEINPNYADAYVVLGIYYKEVASLNSFLKAFARLFFGDLPEGTYEDAVQSFRKAIRLGTSRQIYTYFHLAHIYEETNEPKQAKKLYLKALQFPASDHQDHRVIKRIQERLQSL